MSHRVLILEDDEDAVTLLTHHVKARWPDAKVTAKNPADHSFQAEAIQAQDYDVVLLDHGLGATSGLDLLKLFRRQKQFPPIIMVTGSEDQALVVSVIKAGAADFISKKTMTQERLTSAMAEALAIVNPDEAKGDPATQEDLPDVLGYHLDKVIGRGSAGTVYQAQRIKDGEQVVLKLVGMRASEKQNQELVERCLREFDVLKKLDSPRIVKIFDQEVTDDGLMLVMEPILGGTLKDLVKNGPLPAPQALLRAKQIAAALADVHRENIIHRDLKPANILIRDADTVALIDFGVAKELSQASDLTIAGNMLGSPAYVSPEQAEGLEVDLRTDLYSLGIILYQMLIGEVPYRGLTLLSVVTKHLYAPLPQLPDRLWIYQTLLDQLLAKRPKDRFPSALKLMRSIDELLDASN